MGRNFENQVLAYLEKPELKQYLKSEEGLSFKTNVIPVLNQLNNIRKTTIIPIKNMVKETLNDLDEQSDLEHIKNEINDFQPKTSVNSLTQHQTTLENYEKNTLEKEEKSTLRDIKYIINGAKEFIAKWKKYLTDFSSLIEACSKKNHQTQIKHLTDKAIPIAKNAVDTLSNIDTTLKGKKWKKQSDFSTMYSSMGNFNKLLQETANYDKRMEQFQNICELLDKLVKLLNTTPFLIKIKIRKDIKTLTQCKAKFTSLLAATEALQYLQNKAVKTLKQKIGTMNKQETDIQ